MSDSMFITPPTRPPIPFSFSIELANSVILFFLAASSNFFLLLFTPKAYTAPTAGFIANATAPANFPNILVLRLFSSIN